jgi:hypothetical protein
LIATLKDRLAGQDFLDTNQVLQRAIIQENQAKDHRAYAWFKETGSKEKPAMNCVGEDEESNEETKVCVVEWVDTAKGKPLACSFLKPSPSKKEEMKFTFDVSKCDKLFDILLQNNVIKLSEGHVIPPPGQLGKTKYCKWHDTYSHATNECNYFHRQVQSALNDGRLTMGDRGWMKLGIDPFPANVNLINFEEKKVLCARARLTRLEEKVW